RPLSRTIFVLAAVSSMNTSRVELSMACRCFQHRRARATFAAHAQQTAIPVVGLVSARPPEEVSGRTVGAFRKGLSETGYVEEQNVTVEYHLFGSQFDRVPSLMADLVRRRVAVIATPGANYAAQVAKAATTTIPIVFGVGEDPVKLGLVASLNRPGGNATGINFFVQEVTAKRLGLLHELVPKAVRIAVLVNPANAPTAEAALREIPELNGRPKSIPNSSRTGTCGFNRLPVCYFGVMPRSFAAFVRTARCSSIDLANSAGPPGLGTWAVVIRRSLMSGSASITVLMSAAMRSRRSFGIVGGPNSPTSPSIVSAGYPASATVGMSGIAEAPAVLVTARTLILPAWICGRAMAYADS